jgi:uncharacterized repeat protein (TIGR01451 family)
MKTKKRLRGVLVSGLMLLVATGVALAQRHYMMANAARPDVKVNLIGSVERDSKVMTLDKATVVRPGEVLTWTVDAVNVGGAPALEYRAITHIPRGTEYVKGSAQAEGANALYSIDGGKSFSPQPMIEQKQADGSVKLTPAPLSMYTSIRYEWANPLAPGAKVAASYQVRVK